MSESMRDGSTPAEAATMESPVRERSPFDLSSRSVAAAWRRAFADVRSMPYAWFLAAWQSPVWWLTFCALMLPVLHELDTPWVFEPVRLIVLQCAALASWFALLMLREVGRARMIREVGAHVVGIDAIGWAPPIRDIKRLLPYDAICYVVVVPLAFLCIWLITLASTQLGENGVDAVPGGLLLTPLAGLVVALAARLMALSDRTEIAILISGAHTENAIMDAMTSPSPRLWRIFVTELGVLVVDLILIWIALGTGFLNGVFDHLGERASLAMLNISPYDWFRFCVGMLGAAVLEGPLQTFRYAALFRLEEAEVLDHPEQMVQPEPTSV